MASILGLLSLFKRVSGTPAKSQGTRAYAVDLGTNVVSDAQIAKTLGMCVRAAVNAAHDLDPEKSARIVRVHLELSEISGSMSRLHIQTVGELGTKAKAGCSIDGRQFSIYETKAPPRRRSRVHTSTSSPRGSTLPTRLRTRWPSGSARRRG